MDIVNIVAFDSQGEGERGRGGERGRRRGEERGRLGSFSQYLPQPFVSMMKVA